jgi:hypothetical protein
MNDFLKKNSQTMIVGLLTTIVFLYILQPVLEFTGSAVMFVGSLVSNSYIDMLYSQIAHLEIMSFGFFFFFIVFVALICISVGLIIYQWTNDVAPEKIEKESISKNILRKKVITTLLLLFSAMYFTVQISTKLYQLSLISSFKQHLAIIAPYIDEQKEELILSQWSLIKTNEDYEAVYIKLTDVAKNNKLDLPTNTIYSLTSF